MVDLGLGLLELLANNRSYTVGIVEDRPAVVGIELWGVDPTKIDLAGFERFPDLRPPGEASISAVDIRLPIGGLLKEYLESTERRDEFVARSPQFPDAWKIAASERMAQIRGTRRRSRRPTLGEDHYQRVAEIYSEALIAGIPPVEAVAAIFVQSRSTAGRWVRIARERGYLPPTRPGRAAGQPYREKENN